MDAGGDSCPPDGGMEERIRARDWTASPLGPPDEWPQPLRTLLGLMLTAVQPMFVAWGPERILLYNDAYAPLLGRKHPEALGRPFFSVWPEAREEIGPLFEEVFAGQPIHMEDITLFLVRRDRREEAHFAFSYTPVRDERGRVSGLFCSCTETTEQVLAQRRRATDAVRQRRLFEQAPGFIAILRGPDHVFDFVNRAYVKLFGNRDYVGRTARQVFPDIEGQGFHELLDHAFETGERHVARDVPIHLRDAPGDAPRERVLNFIHEPVLDDSGRVTGIFVEGHDVTDAFRTAQALRTSEARLRELNQTLEQQVRERSRDLARVWDLSRDLLGVASADGYFIRSNPAWERMLGWSADEMRSTPFLDLVHPDDREATAAVAARLAEGLPSERVENRYRARDGSHRWLQWTAVPDDGLFYCVGRDVTAERERAAALAQAEERLRQSQKMEAVGQLTGGLAHDFNNLLAGISGSLELLSTRLGQNRLEDAGRYIAAAQGAAKRAAALTHRLLAFTRRQTLDPRPTDANRLVHDMEELIRRTVGPAVHLEVAGAPGLWTTLVDPNQLENALLNLCLNARDAMPEGGRLVVETSNAMLDERAAREREVPAGPYVVLCVSDNGVGMTPEVIRRAFDPFFTTKPIGVGTGLGLSMTYGFVRQSGGQARIYSEPGRGTAVRLYLPRHGGPPEHGEEPAEAGAAPRAAPGETVLLVDDEPTIRMLVAEVLEEGGYTTLTAADGPAGLRALRSAARIDLLITDVGLPGGVNGRQLADAARAVRPGLKVLFITGYAENAVLGHGHLEPGTHVLTKPFTMDALTGRIREMIAGG